MNSFTIIIDNQRYDFDAEVFYVESNYYRFKHCKNIRHSNFSLSPNADILRFPISNSVILTKN